MTSRMCSKTETFIPTELLSRRSACGKVFAVGAGRYKAFQSGIQIHALDQEKAEWEEIDARFMPADGIPGLNPDIPEPVYASRGPAMTVTCGIGGHFSKLFKSLC